MALRVLVRGIGDIGSAVAHRLFLGVRVVTLFTSYAIGQQVTAGEVIARIDETSLTAPLGGVVRGLTHDGVPVAAGTKVIEIDPRGDRHWFEGSANARRGSPMPCCARSTRP